MLDSFFFLSKSLKIIYLTRLNITFQDLLIFFSYKELYRNHRNCNEVKQSAVSNCLPTLPSFLYTKDCF